MARVIYADDLFRFMDEHNFQTIGRDRLEAFAKRMDWSDQYRNGYLDGVSEASRRIETIIKEVSQGARTCKSCEWYAPSENVCCNEDSIYGMKYMYPTERCGKWTLSKETGNGDT